METSKKLFVSNLNRAIALIFSLLFVFSLFKFQDSSMLTIYTGISLFLLNVFNFMALRHKGISAFLEALIYEAIAILGIYFVSWYYVLVFVLVAEVLHIFRSRAILGAIILANCALYIFSFFDLTSANIYPGYYLWHMLVSLFIMVTLSIFFVVHEESFGEEEKSNSSVNVDIIDLKQKYNELMEEHQEILLLKEIMELSNHPSDIKDLALQINEMILRQIDNIDYSTIFLFDPKRSEFSVATSNVPVHFHKSLCVIEQFEQFDEVISEHHGKVLSSELGLTYPTAVDRGVRAALCMPLHTQKELIGVLLIESKDEDAFRNMDLNKFNLVRYNISLVVENKQWLQKIERMALVDGLTGVYNRNYLFDFMEKQMKWHQEHTKKLCLVLFDVDHFKKFNDTYGHLFGDLVLKEISSLVKNSIREVDLIARYGGEEFIIALTDTDKMTAKDRIEDIRIKIQNSVVRNEEGTEAKVTVSFGIAEFGQESYNIVIKDLIERADQALYQSKHEGRNRVTVYSQS